MESVNRIWRITIRVSEKSPSRGTNANSADEMEAITKHAIHTLRLPNRLTSGFTNIVPIMVIIEPSVSSRVENSSHDSGMNPNSLPLRSYLKCTSSSPTWAWAASPPRFASCEWMFTILPFTLVWKATSPWPLSCVPSANTYIGFWSGPVVTWLIAPFVLVESTTMSAT